jgi:hypothetical protein
MAAKLCCTAPLRSESPDDTPSRPVRQFKSLANIRTHLTHGRHTAPLATDGQADQNHPLYAADDLELRRIFATVSLPEDHPDAVLMEHRKPAVDESIIRSPSFARKLRKQLSRKTLATGQSSRETIKKSTIRPFAYSRKRLELGLTDLESGYDDDAQSLYLTDSRLASLQNNNACQDINRFAQSDDGSIPEESRRSISVPLVSRSVDAAPQPRRSHSSSDTRQRFEGGLTVHLPGPHFIDSDEIWPSLSMASNTYQSPPLPVIGLSPSKSYHPQVMVHKTRGTAKHEPTQRDSSQSLHLYDMQISQHLRQASEASSASDPDKQLRTTHASLNTIMLSSVGLTRDPSMVSSGFADSVGPSTFEQVLEDESSSIYSRRPSTALETPLVSTVEHSVELLEEKPDDCSLIELSGRSETNTPASARRIVSVSTGISVLTDLPPSPHDAKPSASSTHSTGTGDWPANSMACSLPRSDSSGSLGKLSKFKEDLNDLSAVTKSGKKRRSVLRILLPRFVRSKLRSTSTPLLIDKADSLLASYDGPGDLHDLLSVPQSASMIYSGERTVSFSGGADAKPTSALSPGSLAVTPSPQSRQSLMNYERSLSVVGDDRRRKSTLGGPKSSGQELKEQDDDTSMLALRRADPLFRPGRKGTEEALMEKALQQHQLEKAALLRPSNHKNEVTPTPFHTPVFKTSFGFPSSSEARLGASTFEDLDPLEAEGPSIIRRSQSMQDLGPIPGIAGDSVMFRKKKGSTAWTVNTATTRGTRHQLQATTPPHSWSRYPSHNRERRCSAASRHDGIISRDFAYLETPRNIKQTVSTERIASSPRSWPRLTHGKKRSWIFKSQSMTFSTVLRYYSSIFTSSAARNRRSSTAVGGRLEHPDLEMLPPILPQHTDFVHPVGVIDRAARPLEHVQDGHTSVGGEVSQVPNQHHESPPHMDGASCKRIPRTGCMGHDPESRPGKEVSRKTSLDRTQSPISLNGPTDTSRPVMSERALSARRLSRMYQAYVQLPASLDNTEAEQSDITDGPLHLSEISSAAGLLETEAKNQDTGSLKVPSGRPRMYSGPITRHFPSVTVVDDRKGHWRSVSLMSVDSGKSVRKSTRDLLEVVKAAETEELQKLLGKSEVSVTEEETD